MPLATGEHTDLKGTILKQIQFGEDREMKL